MVSTNQIPSMLAALRADIIRDLNNSRRYAIRVAMPDGIVVSGWSLADPPSHAVIVGGYKSASRASNDAPAIVAEVAAKIANAIICPTSDPPICVLCAWSRICIA